MQSNIEPLRPENSGCARLRVVEPGYKNIEGNCESCGLPLWIFGAHRVEGLKGLYCSVLCIECALFGHGHCRWCGSELDGNAEKFCREACRNRSAGVPFGNGQRLFAWIRRNKPVLYQSLMRNPPSKCGGCGAVLTDQREGAAFCSDVCRLRDWRGTGKTQNSGIYPFHSGRNKGLTEGDFPGGYLGMENPKADENGPCRGFLAGGGNGN